MTTYTVKNAGYLDKAFRVYDGFKVVVAGEDAEVTTTEPLTDEQIEALARDKVKVTEKKAKDPLDHDGDGKKGGSLPKSDADEKKA